MCQLECLGSLHDVGLKSCLSELKVSCLCGFVSHYTACRRLVSFLHMCVKDPGQSAHSEFFLFIIYNKEYDISQECD